MVKYILIVLCILTKLSAAEPILVVFGPPGAGKGTFSQFVNERYGYIHLSVGDIIREEIDRQTDIGKKAEYHLKKGEFLDESMIQAVIVKHLTPLVKEKKKIILDGFPRTIESAYFLKEYFDRFDLSQNVYLIMLRASDETCCQRILSRIVCKSCGHIFNILSAPPIRPMTCDNCGCPLKIRSNDTEEIIRIRLREFHEMTEKTYALTKAWFSSSEFVTEASIDDCLQNYRCFFDEQDA